MRAVMLDGFLLLLSVSTATAQGAGRTIGEVMEAALSRQITPGVVDNGAELIEIVVPDGSPMLKSGELMLPVRPLEGGGLGALLDNRVALRFHFMTDADGRPYLWLGNRALAREQPQ